MLDMSQLNQIALCKVFETVEFYLIEESVRAFPNETGGMLVGRLEGNCALITDATGPGPKALHSPSLFQRDGDYSQVVLDNIVVKSDGLNDYIGEWHSHPVRCSPSAKDRAAMRWVANNANYAASCPLMALCTHQSTGIWYLTFFVLENGCLRVLESSSSRDG